LKCFDEFLERRFPESRRKAYYLMSIHEHLPPQARKQLQEVGWTKGLELAKLARRDRQHFDCATWLHKARQMPKEDFKKEVEKELTGAGNRTVRAYLFQALPYPFVLRNGYEASLSSRRQDSHSFRVYEDTDHRLVWSFAGKSLECWLRR
jgi:hypothetical protein